MADGYVKIKVTADDKDAQTKLNQLRKDIEKTQAAIEKSSTNRNAISESMAQAREEIRKATEEINDLQAQKSEIGSLLSGQAGDISASEMEGVLQAQKEVDYSLKQQLAIRDRQEQKLTDLGNKERLLTAEIEQQTARLAEQQDEAGAVERIVAEQASRSMPQLSQAAEQASAAVGKGFKNILKWGFGIRSVFVLMRRLRSYIKEAVTAFAESDAETKANLDGLKKSLATLKVSWGAAFAPILNAVAPMLQTLIRWLTAAADAVQQFFAILGGRNTYKRAISNNEDLADSFDGAGGAAKDAQKDVLGFDELNKLSDKSGGGGGGGGGSPEQGIEDAAVNQKFKQIIDQIRENLAAVEFIAGTSLLAIGTILALSGANIPLGLGLMAAGAITLAHAIGEDWSAINPKVSSAVSEIAVIVGAALLTIGALLAFSGANIPLGIGLMAAGLTGYAAVALNWDNLPNEVQRTVTTILTVLGTALLAMGAVLAFSGANIPLGIAMIAAGAISLVSAAALNWEFIVANIRGIVSDITGIMAAALLALGALLVFSGANIPLGIGLLAAGGVSLAANIALNWDFIVSKIRGVKDKIVEIINQFKTKLNDLKVKVGEIKDSIVNKFNEIKSGIEEKINAAKDAVKTAIDKIKGFFDFEWTIPHINLPHITVSWTDTSNSSIAQLLGITAIPSFGIEWYAKGGIVNGATLFGAGEDGAEAVVPLERHTEWIRRVADGIIDGLMSNNRLGDYISSLPMPALAMGQVVPPRSIGGGSMFTDGDIERLARGISAALSGGSEAEQSIKLYLDGRQIAETVTRHQRRAERGLY